MANIEFIAWGFDAAGGIDTAAVMKLYAFNTTTPVSATVNADANGRMAISHATEGRFDVELVSGTQKIRRKWDSALQLREIETANLLLRNPAFTFKYDIVPAAITADRQLDLPLITATDTLMALALHQATQAAIVAETNEDTYVPPDRVKFSPGVAKAWGEVNAAGVLQPSSVNIASIGDVGVGVRDINFTTAFSSTEYKEFAQSHTTAANNVANQIDFNRTSASVTRMFSNDAEANAALDIATFFLFFGDQ